MTGEYDYDVAVSFAGEDRAHVEAVVEGLKARDVSVFYDQDFTSELWGENLVDFLQSVYRHRARFVIIFVSRHYLEKEWTRHERQSAQDRALQQASPYILPVRLDDAELPGLHTTTGYLDARTVGVDGVVDAMVRKLGAGRVEPAPRFNGRVPRTSEEIAVLLSERPNCWEYLLYAGVLKQGIDAVEDKYRDHVLEYAPRNGKYLRGDEVLDATETNMALLLSLSESFDRVLDPRTQDVVFGRPGEQGDADRIIHLARRLVSVYEEFLDCAATLRGTSVSSDAARRVLDTQARWANQPIEVIRRLVADYVAVMDTAVERTAAGENLAVEMNVKLELDDGVVEQYNQAVRAFSREWNDE